MSDSNRQSRYDFAKSIAVSGGKLTMKYFQNRDLGFEKKGDHSPVTIADRQVEDHIRQQIAERFPDDSIVGEEYGSTDGKSEFKWIIDPIDGTKSFISGVPLFGTMVGVLQNEKPVIGAIYFPALDEVIFGCVGEKTVYGASDSSISDLSIATIADRNELSEVVFVTSEADSFAEREAGDVYQKLEKSCYITRTWGDCYGYYLVATGRAHLMVDPQLSIWDAAAVMPIVSGAGGVFCDWAGDGRIDAGESIGMVPGIRETVLKLTSTHAGDFGELKSTAQA